MKIPYHQVAAVKLEQRREHILSSLARGLPRLERRPIDESATLHIAAYGPSLHHTWQELRRPIMSMSGATKFLADRGIIPDFHIDVDPRKHKVMTSLPPVKGVTYLVGSSCVPEYFDALKDERVILWHTVSSDWENDLKWISQHDHNSLVINPGSTIGLAAIHVGGVMGFRRFHIHGMDASFDGDQRHAGPHAGKKYPCTKVWAVNKHKYRTNELMCNAAAETVNTFNGFPIIGVFYGHGLTQALIREKDLPNACCADQFEKRVRLSVATVNIADLPPWQKGETAWDGFLDALEPTDLPELVLGVERSEPRRALARYDTGSIPIETSLLLRAMCRYYKPTVIAEIGTFIGTSTEAMLANRVIYTCDQSNDCLPGTESVITHPYQSSTQMLKEIHEPVDFFFFDGRIQPEDVPEIQRVSHRRTVYAFDDFTGKEKGVANLHGLMPHLKDYVLVPPFKAYDGRSTLAALVPAVNR
jgi:6-hydroxymethylpterin diphosphokinase MptE-like protein